MERIGIAASKMAQGNLWLYNLFVVLISFLFSFFIFFIAGSSIVLALIIIGYVVNGILPRDLWDDWHGVIRVCMISLTIIVSIFTLFAILRNMRFKLRK
jgi:hypothetical protein